MAERYAILSGNWSNPATWDGLTTVPGAADDVYANNFTVTVDQDVTVLSLRTTAGTTAVAGGGFTTAVSRSVTVTGAGIVAGSTTCLTLTGASGQTLTVTGAVAGGTGTNARGVNNSSTGAVVVAGAVAGGSNGSGAAGINNASTGTITVTGNVTSGPTGTSVYGINNASTGTITVTGNVTGGASGAAYGINMNSGGTLTVNGNVTGGGGNNLYGVNVGTATVTVNGNVTGGSHAGAPAINFTTGTVTVNGDLIPATGNAVEPGGAGKLILNGNIQSVSTGVGAIGGDGAIFVIKSTTTLTHAYRTDNAGAIGAERVLSTSGSGQNITVPLSDQGALATAQSKTTATTLSTTSNITADPGQLIVLVVATDNEATADGETNLHTALTVDGQGATKAKEYTNTVGGAANDGVTVSVWYLVVGGSISAGSTVLSTLNSGKDAKALTSHVFDLDSAYSISVDGTATLANDNADPGSMSATGSLDAPHLWVRAIGVETDNTTAGTLTPTAGWTAMTGTGTTGGGAATNVSVRAEFKVANGTASGTSDPTLVSADCASVLVGLAASIPGGISNSSGAIGLI